MGKKSLSNRKHSSHPKQDWLDSAVFAKAHLLKFAPPYGEQRHTIDIGRFGFKNPSDLINFLRTPAGDTIKANLSEHIAKEQGMENHQLFTLQEDAIRRHRLKSLLLLWLIEKKGYAAANLRELIEEQNEKILKENAKTSQKQLTTYSASDDLTKALSSYDKAFNEYSETFDVLNQNDAILKTKLERLMHQEESIRLKHQVYDEKLAEFEQLSQNYEDLNPQELEQEITQLEEQLFAQTDRITELLEEGKDDAAHELIHQQNALNHQIANLHDIRSIQQNNKVFLDENGEIISSHKKAAFVLPKQLAQTKKIVKENGQYYLIGQDEQLSDLNPVEKTTAKESFDGISHEIMSVKKIVQHTRELEIKFQKSLIEETEKQIDENQLQLLMMSNQLTLVQTSRANALTMSLPRPTPPVINFFKNNAEIFKTPSLSSKLLFNQADKAPQDAEEVKAFLKSTLALLGNGQIPSMAPLPQATMTSLLQHMARFGAEPYKFSPNTNTLGTQVALTPMSENNRNFHPTPFSKTPFNK